MCVTGTNLSGKHRSHIPYSILHALHYEIDYGAISPPPPVCTSSTSILDELPLCKIS